MRPAAIGELVRRHGDAHSLLGAPDLREDGLGHAPLAAVAVRAAVRAARAVRETVAGGPLQVDTKLGVHDLVTTADRAAEAAAIAEIRRARPDDAILAEESGEHPGTSGVEWIIDPVDGTGNFVLGRADHAVSVAAYRGAAPLAAVIHRPADGAWAATGEDGPTGNLPLACTSTDSLRRALVSSGFPARPGATARVAAAAGAPVPARPGLPADRVGVLRPARGRHRDAGRLHRRGSRSLGLCRRGRAGGGGRRRRRGGRPRDGSRAVVVAAPGIAGELVELVQGVRSRWMAYAAVLSVCAYGFDVR